MIRLEIATRERRLTFAPGDVIEGTVSWTLQGVPEELELRLLWYTEGRGDQDVSVVEALALALQSRGEETFRFQVPDGPLSFSGQLISLAWALELVTQPGQIAERLEILVSETGREIRLTPLPNEGAGEMPERLAKSALGRWLAEKARQKRDAGKHEGSG